MVRRNRDGSPRPHQGWYLHALPGTPIYAVSYGKVEFVRNWQDYGLQICISFEHKGTKYFAFYAHLKSVNVKTGDAVTVGEHIGHSGASGNAGRMLSKEQHLHFEIRIVANPGKGLVGRISPIRIYNVCSLKSPILQQSQLPQNIFNSITI
ncbi:M23 family metallopeptidase [Photobacterium nomapromontoriensis]|uniref:M23 family metallopeptidase n=1 Tax=Photobacterium nomapromontoriensis TaxID=2910237 RepID=UPI003D0F8E83